MRNERLKEVVTIEKQLRSAEYLRRSENLNKQALGSCL